VGAWAGRVVRCADAGKGTTGADSSGATLVIVIEESGAAVCVVIGSEVEGGGAGG